MPTPVGSRQVTLATTVHGGDAWEELENEDGDADLAPSRRGRLTARRALTEQAAPESEDGPRERALRALAETAEALLDMSTNHNWNADALPLYHLEDAGTLDIGSGLWRLYWTENSAVLISGARDRVRGAKLEALKALHMLANEAFIASLLWADEHGARAALLAAAAAGHEDEDVGFSAHSTLSLIACAEGCAAQMWQHPPTRQMVLSTVRGSQVALALRIRLEAWDTLLNSVEFSSSVPQPLWVGDAAADVRSVVMLSLSDDAEGEVVKLKALAFVAVVIKKGGADAAAVLWAEELARCTRIEGGSQQPPRYTFLLPACADSTEASATRLRHAALRLLCASCAELPKPAEPGAQATEEPRNLIRLSDGASEAARSFALSAEVMRVLLAAFEGGRAVLQEDLGRQPTTSRATLREECETEYERLEMSRAARDGSGSGDGACLPLRERARYASLSVDERLARLRRIWERNNRGKGKLGVRVTLGSIMEDLLNLGQKLGDCDYKKLQDAGVTNLRFAFDRGSDAGGLTRHCFAEFGKGLADVESVSATAGALREVKRMLKEWKPSLRSESAEAAALMEQVRTIVQQNEAEAADTSGRGHGGGGEGSGSMGPPAPKRPRVSKPPAMLFKLTESGSLAPSGAETLCGRVGEATDEAGAIVPDINGATLRRYRAIGRVCALALVNNATLGLPFARYFLRLVLNEPPKTLADLQAEEEAERASKFGLGDCLKSSLADQGMEGMMTFSRQASIFVVPLRHQPSLEVTDDNKADFMRRNLEHQLVRTIEKQAIAFREGVEEITGVGWLQLLSAAELKEVWGGHAIDDGCLTKWREHTRCGRAGSETVVYFWEWLGKCSEATRAQVLQFATGSLRLPGDSELNLGWKFVIESLDHFQMVAPTETNGLSAPAMLARASTCSNTIYLPPYADVDAVEKGMRYSLMDGGFGLA